jgi:hypothetical protein
MVFRKVGGKSPPNADRMHPYPLERILKPRGEMEEESLSLKIYEILMAAYDNWTDTAYVDNPDPQNLLETLAENYHDEVCTAWDRFIEDTPSLEFTEEE